MANKNISDANKLDNLARQMRGAVDRCQTEGARKALKSAIDAMESEIKDLRRRGEYE